MKFGDVYSGSGGDSNEDRAGFSGIMNGETHLYLRTLDGLFLMMASRIGATDGLYFSSNTFGTDLCLCDWDEHLRIDFYTAGIWHAIQIHRILYLCRRTMGGE